jgi:NAD(P)-dependent dehydrogenase (short-subunit alcohol dehydrogenase family)
VTEASRGQSAQLLSGKHALVTGGARGIGAAIVEMLLVNGARVTSVSRASALAKSHLVNNAGQAASAPFLKTDPALWRSMMAVNLDGTFHCTQAALAGMLAAGWGRIINVASTAGLTGYGYVTAYCAAKHGVVGLTRALAIEVATKGVTVNAVCPGFTDTDIVKEAVANIVAKTGRTAEQAEAELASRNPQKRLKRLRMRPSGSACREAKPSRGRQLLWPAAS